MSEADRLSDINATFQCIQTLFDKADTDDEDPMLFELESKDSGFNEREEFERRLFMNSKQTNSNVLNASTSKSPFNADYPGRSPDVLEEAYPRRVKRKVMESPSPTDRAAGLVDIKSSPVDKGTMASSSSSYGLITPLNGFTTPTDYSRTIGSTGSFTGSLKREGIDTHSLEHNVSNLHISTNSAIKKEFTSPYLFRQEDNASPHAAKHDEKNFKFNIPHSPYQPLQSGVSTSVATHSRRRRSSSSQHNMNISPPSFSNYHKNDMHNIRLGEPKLGDTVLINGHEFVILKEVGKGSSGRVFQALSNRYHEIFALKWIEIKRDDDRQSIQNEIQLMRKLGRLENVDTVVLLFDFMSTPDAIYLVMELGEIDLASLLKRQHKKKFNMSNIRSWWHQILLAVKTIHDEEIVHTDLKPANFVMVKGTLKLIDFGIAKKIEDDTLHIHRDNQVGTINYMSPEALIEVNESFSQRILIKQGKPSDVWSLGCILYHMVYGRPPFYHLTPPQKVLKIPDHAHPIPFPFEATDGTGAKVTLSKDLIILMKHCLNRDAAARPSVGELLNHPFCQ